MGTPMKHALEKMSAGSGSMKSGSGHALTLKIEPFRRSLLIQEYCSQTTSSKNRVVFLSCVILLPSKWWQIPYEYIM